MFIMEGGGYIQSKRSDIMRLLFKQRFFSWFDSFDIYDEAGDTVFSVEGRMAWGHKL